MRKNSGTIWYSGAHTSPGTPEYGEMPKPWSSERVALPTTSGSRRHVSAAALMPFNSGRALPSKWEDAERWITSPLSGHGLIRTPVAQPQRRPKSKSGPLGPAGLVYSSAYSPIMPMLDNANVRNSPLTTGVLISDRIPIHYETGVAGSLYAENNVLRSSTAPGLSDLVSEASVSSSQDDKSDGVKEEEAPVLKAVYRRDMATQMSPEGSTRSSSNGRLSFSTTITSSLRQPGYPASKDEVRDVQVDRGTTTASQSKKLGPKKIKKMLSNVDDLPSPWNASDTSKSVSKLQREEAKITAWENLQKAKAEASIRKLEMKLEKKRSAGMDKILNRLRAAQMRAESMRNSLSESRSPASCRRVSLLTYVKTFSLGNCFFNRRN